MPTATVEMNSHISQAYFYTELLRSAGQDVADTWIRDQSRGASRTSFKSTPSHSHRSTPIQSRNVSPRGTSSGSGQHQEVYHRAEANHERSEVPAGLTKIVHQGETDGKQTLRAPGLTVSQSSRQLSRSANDLSLVQLTTDADDRSPGEQVPFGLLYTDAAHTVLDKIHFES